MAENPVQSTVMNRVYRGLSWLLLMSAVSGAGEPAKTAQEEASRIDDYKGDDPYDILGVPSTATKAEIKKAYRQLSKTLHPDHRREGKQATERFQRINEAYSTLDNLPDLNAHKTTQQNPERTTSQEQASPYGSYESHLEELKKTKSVDEYFTALSEFSMVSRVPNSHLASESSSHFYELFRKSKSEPSLNDIRWLRSYIKDSQFLDPFVEQTLTHIGTTDRLIQLLARNRSFWQQNVRAKRSQARQERELISAVRTFFEKNPQHILSLKPSLLELNRLSKLIQFSFRAIDARELRPTSFAQDCGSKLRYLIMNP